MTTFIFHIYMKYKSFRTTRRHSSIRFYDNTTEIIKQFNKTLKNIDTKLVSDKPNKEILESSIVASNYTKKFLKLYPDNKYAQDMENKKITEIKTSVGFYKKDAKELLHWANTKKGEKIAIFDWDGTLSILEGVSVPKDNTEMKRMKNDGITFYEMAVYYAGTIERLNMLKDMFIELHKKKVKIFILTNNPIASKDWQLYNKQYSRIGPNSRNNFYRLVKEFIPELEEQNVLCGRDTNGFKPGTFMQNKTLSRTYSRSSL